MNAARYGLLPAIALVGTGLLAYAGHSMTQQSHITSSRNSKSDQTSAHASAQDPVPESKPSYSDQSPRTEAWRAIRPDLFSMPHPESAASGPQPAPSSEVKGAASNPVVFPVSDPLADYVYAGTVTIDGKMSALLEHRKSKEGWYVQAGDTWQNYRILSVTADALTVQVNGEVRTLAKSDAYNAVPLLAGADKGQSASMSTASTPIALAEYTTQVQSLNTVFSTLFRTSGSDVSTFVLPANGALDQIKISLDSIQISNQ